MVLENQSPNHSSSRMNKPNHRRKVGNRDEDRKAGGPKGQQHRGAQDVRPSQAAAPAAGEKPKGRRDRNRPPKAAREQQQQQKQQQQEGGGGGNSGNSGKSAFEPHLTEEQLGQCDGLVFGPLRVNHRNYKESYVASPRPNHPDVVIQGVKHRNRAFNGDEVAVALLPEKEWVVMDDRVEDYVGKKGLVLNQDKTAFVSKIEQDLQDRAASVETKIETLTLSEPVELPAQDEPPKDAALKEPLEEAAEEDSDVDVVVEAVVVHGKDGVVQAQAVEHSKGKKKGTRRGTRGAKGKNKHKNQNQDQAVSKPSPNNQKQRQSPPKENVFSLKCVQTLPCWEELVQKTGKVVAITAIKHSRKAAGHLRKFPDGNPQWALFAPNDSRVPRMKIAKAQCPNNFWSRPQDFETSLFVGRIKKWDQQNYALGELETLLGDASDIEARTKGILLSNGVEYADFSGEVLDCLPPLPFAIPPAEAQKRRDFRGECVFTIDPSTARDLDDALSVEQLGGGRYRIAVHIADVSYFVREGSELDRAARLRATSVYLIQTVIPMLPRTLCEDLCSLNPDEDRLAFSVEWIMDESGHIDETWFGRSIIKSCCKLSYEHAQDMLDSPDKSFSEDELPPISSPWKASDIISRVNALQRVAVNLRQARIDGGALRLDQPKLAFKMDKETGMPHSYHLYEHRHSNRLIEEFMLLANISVAKKIHSAFPKLAVLRSHPRPKENMLSKLLDKLHPLGFDIDDTTSKTLADSLKRYEGGAEDPAAKARYQVLVNLFSKPMELARYFCSGQVENPEDFRHFALSVDLYTHFTSPIRRYPDVLVHRLLDAAIGGADLEHWQPFKVDQVAKHCNDKKLSSKRAGEESAEIFLGLFVKETGPIETWGVVTDVKTTSFDVLVVEMATTKRLFFSKEEPNLEKFESGDYYRSYKDWDNANQATISILWKGQGPKKAEVQKFQLFDRVDLLLEAAGRPLDIAVRLRRPGSERGETAGGCAGLKESQAEDGADGAGQGATEASQGTTTT